MKICPRCGGIIDEATGFCTKCGNGAFNNNTNQVLNAQTKLNKKRNKKVLIAIIAVVAVLVVMLICIFAASLNADTNQEDSVQSSAISSSEFTLNYDTGFKLSDNIYDYQIMIDNTVYQFPMSVSDFMATGLSVSSYDDPNELIRPGYEESIWFTYNDGSKFIAYVVNFAKSEAPVTDCHVVGVSLYSNQEAASEILFDTTKIKMAKNITLGVSTYDDVVSAYGNANDTSLYEEFGKIKYAEDLYRSVEFTFDESNILKAIDIENIEQPTDVIDQGISNKTPEKVANYVAPSSLGSDISSGVFELEGQIYKLPVPVSELLNDGWKITNQSADSIAGLDIEYVDLSKGNVTITDVKLANDENYEVTIENGIIEDIDSTSFEYGKEGKVVLPGNITEGSSESQFKQALVNHSYTTRDSAGSITYSIQSGNYTVNVNVENGTVQYVSISYMEL